ncbi:MAG: ABC-F family ATP-binding cassette domain-containing protein [Lachnospiraceae bacterium]|nr:ABC-F family ATP-binding cassette domain-containing protein [Lachnospiraceae bacterium]
MIYKISNGSVSLGGNTILERVDFEIKNKKEKIAVVGRNGSGKTTLLRLISGEIESDTTDGIKTSINSTGDPVTGYLKQAAFEDDNRTLDEEIQVVFRRFIRMKERLDELTKELSKSDSEKLINEYTSLLEKYKDEGGYYYLKEYDVMLKSFGFSEEDKTKRLSEFSGGERTKLAFIRLLLSKPDILLLDEPTNHLDMETIEWLEGYLKSYPYAVVLVSHDRMFIDHIADTVYEIEYHNLKRYNGNYSDFIRQKKENYDKQLKDHIKQLKEIERLNNIAERFKNKPTKVSMARSKLKAVEHMDIIDAPKAFDEKTFHVDYKPAKEPGKDILFVKDLAIGYDEVITRLSFEVKKRERVGIIGGNGLGKSTLLKTITGVISPLGGTVRYGTNVEVGYFDQQMAEYTSDKNVIDDFHDEFPELTDNEVRSSLGAFLFSGDDVYKEVRGLSGGEKVRLALCKIIKRKPNFLILDEPTNHMDIASKEALEDMLLRFEGTVMFVSHDRYFVKKLASRLFLIEKDRVRVYSFGYAQYEEEQEKQRLAKEGVKENIAMGGSVISDPKLSENKEGTDEAKKTDKTGLLTYEAQKEASRRAKRIKRLEEDITRIEEEIALKKEELNDERYATDYIKLKEIQDEANALEEKLIMIMEEWDELNA